MKFTDQRDAREIFCISKVVKGKIVILFLGMLNLSDLGTFFLTVTRLAEQNSARARARTHKHTHTKHKPTHTHTRS
jgi:hypothetical protein